MTKLKSLNILILLVAIISILFVFSNDSSAETEKTNDEIYAECEERVTQQSPEYGEEFDNIMAECLDENGYNYLEHEEKNSSKDSGEDWSYEDDYNYDEDEQ